MIANSRPAHPAGGLELQQWLQSVPGQQLVAAESARLAQMLPQLFGYVAVQLGCWDDAGVPVDALRTQRVFRLDVHPGPVSPGRPAAWVDAEALPLAPDSVDVVLLLHTLEYVQDPHRLLREVDQALRPDGCLVIAGCNPYSLWGLRRRLPRGQPRWAQRFLPESRLNDWLKLLAYDVLETRRHCYRPPLNHPGAAARLAFLERWGEQVLLLPHGAYVLLARKRTSMLTPIRPRWRLTPAFTPALARARGATAVGRR